MRVLKVKIQDLELCMYYDSTEHEYAHSCTCKRKKGNVPDSNSFRFLNVGLWKIFSSILVYSFQNA